jgi:hypothetical protein
VAALSIFTVAVLILIAIFDLKSTADAAHARIPYIYLGYIALGIGWYAVRPRKADPVEA